MSNKIHNSLDIISRLTRYNLKIIFGNKFFYFLLTAFLFFVLVTVIELFSDTNPDAGSVYYLLIFPGLLLIFYPASFGIQNDADARMLEVLFGIPNYRYKVWLVRIAIIYVVVFCMMLLLSVLSNFTIALVPVLDMVFQLMFPIFFFGSLAFMFSTLIRNGPGTAVVMVIIGLAFWITTDWLSQSKWNLFLNPFDVPSEINEIIWSNIVLNNRLILIVGTVITLLFGLLSLQKRERFV